MAIKRCTECEYDKTNLCIECRINNEQKLYKKKLSISDLRIKSGMSVIQFAEYIGIPLFTIEMWERGENQPSYYIVKLIEYKLKNENYL